MAFEFSNPGSPIREIRAAVWKDGQLSVDVVGKENLQAEIDSFADSCNIEMLVQRCVNGESDILNQRQGFYGDFTDYPKSYAEMVQLMVNAKSYFDSLPLEIRNKFNNDVNVFISEMDKKDWFVKAGFVTPAVDDVVPEVKE